MLLSRASAARLLLNAAEGARSRGGPSSWTAASSRAFATLRPPTTTRLTTEKSSARIAMRTTTKRRGLASHAGKDAHAEGDAYGGFHAPHVATWHKVAGDTMMTVMFLWIFYRAKEDLTFVLGIEHPWDAHHHDHHDDGDDHGDHGDGKGEWTREHPGQIPKLG